MNIKVLGVEVEQSPYLVRVVLFLLGWVAGQGVHLVELTVGMTQVVPIQIGLGWVALWEVGLD